MVFNLMNRQKKLVVMNHHCLYVLKTNTVVIIPEGRLSTKIQVLYKQWQGCDTVSCKAENYVIKRNS